jgi:hypothetical protein
MEEISTFLSKDHVKDWGVIEAIREVLQNYVDVIREERCGGSVTWEEGFAHMRDYGSGMQMKDLAFGHSEKAKGSVGMFGEGIKSAFVVLARENRYVEIVTGITKIVPILKPNVQFDNLETLHYEKHQLQEWEGEIKGTDIIVQCFREELDEAKKYFVVLSPVQFLENNKISLPAGNIYVNNSKISSVENAMFSYHLEGDEAETAVNRDRDGDVRDITKPLMERILFGTGSEEVIEKYLKVIVHPQECYEESFSYASWRTPLENKSVWKKVWKKHYGDKIVLSDNIVTDNHCEQHGYKVLTGLSSGKKWLLEELGVKTSKDIYKAKCVEGQDYRKEDLEPIEKENLDRALQLVDKYYYWVNPRMVIVSELPENIFGSYDPNSDLIRLSRDILDDKDKTLQVLLHEAIHKFSGAMDYTASFEEVLEKIIVKTINKHNDNKEKK